MSIETYGRYQLLKRLAMGGMAQLYLARQQGPEGFEKLVVVKRILPHLAENDDFVKMFLDEARIAARLNHANVVQIFDLGAQDDSFFIAMEYIHGEDMRRVWKQSEAMGQPVPVPLACRVLIESCAGLDYAHKRTDPVSGRPLGIVHRDVSPQNILVTFEGGVKVVDFGIAKAADQATVTRSGVLKGKYSYMSPEQAAGQRVDCRSDIFALGVVLYELLTGTRLFKRGSDIQTLAAVAECKVIPPSQANPRVPVDLDPIVLKALAKDPAERYQEAVHLQLALEDWLSANRLPSSTAHVAAYMKEIYAERLASESRSGELLLEDSDSASALGSLRHEPASRRSGLRPSLSRAAVAPEGETAALRPRGTGKTGRMEAVEPGPRQSGMRRAVEPPAEPRSSRSGLGAVSPPARGGEEEAPTLDGRAASRATLTDIKVASETRAASRVTHFPPRDSDGGGESRSMTRQGPAVPHQVEEDAPTLAMPELASPPPRLSRAALQLPMGGDDGMEEEDVPTLSLGMSRPGRKAKAAADGARPAEPPPQSPRMVVWITGACLVLVVCVLLWTWLRPGASTSASVRVESEPSGARVVFDGRELPERTPVTLPSVAEGRYPLVVSREGYQELRTEVEVRGSGPVALGVLRLVPSPHQQAPVPETRVEPATATEPPVESAPVATRVRLRVEAEPSQSIVYVDGRQQGAAPVVLEVPQGVAMAIRVEAARHQPSERTVKVGEGPEQLERFSLQQEARVAPPPAPPVVRVPRPEPRVETRTARVRFAVQPWAEVTCGGKKLGETPFEAVELRVGTYDCKFFNPDLKKTLSRRIEVKPIDLNVVSVKFE
ncbi:protein kinase [Myxococcus sp. K15C18031901]|uniref:protein kinase domain-containing protein n=1 Tax=Myxococcus dinghuensis TaxID=2906761 RepID=UPI0020A79F67|nr:protein kinase [Myxococcus dinghuensis]MCP3101373.1 protein kinase [Myxococcus dinghuensis]